MTGSAPKGEIDSKEENVDMPVSEGVEDGFGTKEGYDDNIEVQNAKPNENSNLEDSKRKSKRRKKISLAPFKMRRWTLRLNFVLVHICFIPTFSLFIGSLWDQYAEYLYGVGMASSGRATIGGMAFTFGTILGFQIFQLRNFNHYHIVSKLFIWTYYVLFFSVAGGFVIYGNTNPAIIRVFGTPALKSTLTIFMQIYIYPLSKKGTWFKKKRSDPRSTKFVQDKFVYTGIFGLFFALPVGFLMALCWSYILLAGGNFPVAIANMLTYEKHTYCHMP